MQKLCQGTDNVFATKDRSILIKKENSMKKKATYLSRIEWELMKICWDKGKTTAKVIHEESLKIKERGYQTIKTMLDRMAVKGFLERERFGPVWLYKPTSSRSKGTMKEISDFVKLALDGSHTAIFEHFLRSTTKDSEEFKALKKMIRDFEKDKLESTFSAESETSSATPAVVEKSQKVVPKRTAKKPVKKKSGLKSKKQ